MGELINGRTAEEIKRGCKVCGESFNCVAKCPYYDVEHDCMKQMSNDTLALIERLEAAQPRWISVEDRLPEKQFRVIVRTGHNLVTTGWRSCHVDVRGGELWEVDGAHNYHNDVTHWMPLPEPPKESE